MPKLSKRRIGTEGQYPFGDVGGIYMHVSANGRTQAYANKKLQVIRMDIEYKECIKTVMFWFTIQYHHFTDNVLTCCFIDVLTYWLIVVLACCCTSVQQRIKDSATDCRLKYKNIGYSHSILHYFSGKINVCYNESVHNNLYRWLQKRISTYKWHFIVEVVDAIPIAGIKQALTVIRRVSHNLQDRGMIKIIFGSPIFSIFQWNSFGNEGEKYYFCTWEKCSFD